MDVEAGTQNGDKVRIKGKGVKKINSIGRGNMYVIYDVIIPSKLSMSQKKLFKELNETDLRNDSEFRNFEKYL